MSDNYAACAREDSARPAFIEVERRGRVGRITLQRPEALNALNRQICLEVTDAVARFDADDGIGAIIIAGSERAFAAGADIAEMELQSTRELSVSDPFREWDVLSQTRTPLIAAVAGYALGGGCELAMMCDIIVAADTALFGQPEITLGIMPGMGGTQRLAHAVGYYKAAELVLRGRSLPAAEAEAIGLVSQVVPAAELEGTVQRLADDIAEKPLSALYAAKAALRATREVGLQQGLQLERVLFRSLFSTEDQKEGMEAFREKRAPHFTQH